MTNWPEIPFSAWRKTHEALHLYLQIVGKYRLAHTPWLNHSWHATLYVHPRGLTTSLVADGAGGIEVLVDLLQHRVFAHAAGGATASFDLCEMSVANFHAHFVDMIAAAGGNPTFHHRPNEVQEPVPFVEDNALRPYDAEAVQNFHTALLLSHRVFERFRTGFIGKVSPVHLFWGSFDLAVTRFSGRPAPLHPGGIPALPDEITREAYSHEVSSAGFWAGGGPVDEAAFYSYAYPAPAGFDTAEVSPAEAYFDKNFGEFILPYSAVSRAADPAATLLSFLESTYAAAAQLGQWDRSALQCPTGIARKPRPI